MSAVIRVRSLTPARRLVVACLALAASALLLTGCGDRMQDLKQYVAQTKALRGGPIAPLPQIKPMQTFTYDEANLRSPFVPVLQNFANSGISGNARGLHPDINRPRQYLEQFPLDSLKMMGTVTLKGAMDALIRDGDGVVHRVTVGNYMGQNFGKIVKISQAGLILREIVPDGQGGWTERTTTVQLGG
ncbi:MAG TPA: pilus assembly protein PilP [Gammaproteobacteria bacterium]|nr:pilus assembly protein PilP [Gammaproteobacteria bacterium]